MKQDESKWRARGKLLPALGAATLLFAGGCAGDQNEPEPRAARPDGQAGGPVAVFEMKSLGGRPLVDVTLNGKGPYTFFMDTGAGASMLDAGLAKELGLPVTGTLRTGSPLGKGDVEADVVTVSTVGVGDLVFENREMTLFDLAGMMPGGGGPLGVLSYRVFEGDRLEFDYPARELRLYRGGLPEADGRDVFQFSGEIPTIPVTLAGRTYEMHLDTGSPATFTLPLSEAKQLPLAAEPVVVRRGRTVDAEFEVLGADLEGDATIGAITIPRPALRFIDGAPTGNVGSEMIRRFVVTIDPSNNRLRIAAPAAGGGGNVREAAADDNHGKRKRYGIRFHDIGGDPLSVAGVDPGSPAADAGLEAGDLIIAINGDPVESYDVDARGRALRKSRLELVVRRAEGARKIVLSLDD